MELSETLKAKLDKAQSAEEVIRICAEEGIEVTMEQLMEPEAPMNAELDEEALDNVAGGRYYAAAGVRAAIAAVKWYVKTKGVPYLRPRK